MRYTPVLQGASIVLLGNFNPAIFSPAWFALQDLIPDFDPLTAVVQVIHGEYTEFSAGPLKVSVQPERFAIETMDEPFVKSLDVVLGTFGSALGHTPIRQVGINYIIHFALDTAGQRMKLGRALAPVEPWGGWGQDVGAQSPEVDTPGGLRSLVMEESEPEGRSKGGYRRVHIEPSVREEFVNAHVGVYMIVNDHFVIDPSTDAPIDASKGMTILSDKFDGSITKSKSIVSDLMDYASKLK
ncbi:hypothetical protein [Phenylobacterium ferrooxidans]|uniref:Uncharacterized protein n=1 Tax=Phenylobacterium ferrooxidans TaxID=2982689 RepID=A0ABW6CU59_9CAUL